MKHTTEELILGALLVQRSTDIRAHMMRDLTKAELEQQLSELNNRSRLIALEEAEDAADFIAQHRATS